MVSKKEFKSDIIINTIAILFWTGLILIMPIVNAEDIAISKESNIYIYMQSIFKEHYKNNESYSFWTKTKYSNGYVLNEINLSCKTHSYSIKTSKTYDLNDRLLDFKQNNNYNYDWYRTSIVPNSVENTYYKIVCDPINKYFYKLQSYYNRLTIFKILFNN